MTEAERPSFHLKASTLGSYSFRFEPQKLSNSFCLDILDQEKAVFEKETVQVLQLLKQGMNPESLPSSLFAEQEVTLMTSLETGCNLKRFLICTRRTCHLKLVSPFRY